MAWYHAFLVGAGRPTVAVIDQDVPIPANTLEIRTHGLWADHICETALDHWTVVNEAHAVAVDDPAELYGRAHGTQTPIAIDLEWETDGEPYPYSGVTRYEIPCTVHGEILVGDETIDFAGHGQRDHSWGVRDWWQFGWCWTAGRLGDGTRFHGSRHPHPEPGHRVRLHPAARWPRLRRRRHRRRRGGLGDHGFPTAGHVDIDDLGLDIEHRSRSGRSPLVGPEGRVSRFPRALCRFTAADGRSGHGWTEWNQPQHSGARVTSLGRWRPRTSSRRSGCSGCSSSCSPSRAC